MMVTNSAAPVIHNIFGHVFFKSGLLAAALYSISVVAVSVLVPHDFSTVRLNEDDIIDNLTISVHICGLGTCLLSLCYDCFKVVLSSKQPFYRSEENVTYLSSFFVKSIISVTHLSSILEFGAPKVLLAIEWSILTPLLVYWTLSTDILSDNASQKSSALDILVYTSLSSFILFCSRSSLASGDIIPLLLIASAWAQAPVFSAIFSAPSLGTESSRILVKKISISHGKKVSLIVLYVLVTFIQIFVLAAEHSSYIKDPLGHVISALLTTGFLLLYSSTLLDTQVLAQRPFAVELWEEARANEARKSFLRYVFHEVRVPLNSISMGLHLLAGSAATVIDDTETLAMMRDATGVMTEILNDVLSMEKIEEGKFELKVELTPFESILNAAELKIRNAAMTKKVHVDLKEPPHIPLSVRADPVRLQHAVFNLLSAGVRVAPPDGSICVSFRKKPDLAVGQPPTLEFRVFCPGVELKEDDRKEMFVAPVADVSSEKLMNVCVGLLVSRSIVLLHGGHIGVRDVVCAKDDDDSGGSGTEFFLTLECSETALTDVFRRGRSGSDLFALARMGSGILSQALDATSHGESSSMPSSPGSQSIEINVANFPLLTKLNILIVDDVLSNRKMLSMLLAKKGMDSEMAVDGADALEVIKRKPNHFNIIFIDNQMPIVDGLVATRYLREKLNFNDVVVGLTGNAMDEDIVTFKRAGADLVLAKPLKMVQLNNLLLNCLAYGTKSEAISKIKLPGI